jgi:hypothetical protein
MPSTTPHRIAGISLAAALIALAGAAPALAGTPGGRHVHHPHHPHPPLVQRPVAPPANAEQIVPPALDAPAPPPTTGPIVQLALLLDTSNSMDGPIDQARSHLWSVVSDLAARREGCEPVQLQVALFQYGNDGLESADGYVELRAPFTCDLDVISEQLFALRTNGGSEYCGRVIAEAVERLAWIEPVPCDTSVTRVIVIAGNEPFTQGTVSYTESIPRATAMGATVHTVFCGPRETGAATYWADGASLGEGRYCSIDHDHRVVDIETPFDKRISELNTRLNATYVAFGARGQVAALRQTVQDANFADDRFALAGRAAAKASELYDAAAWDLVDAAENEAGEIDLSRVDRDQLPEMLEDLTDEALTAALEAKQAERAEVQAELREQLVQRSAFLVERQGARDPEGLGAALIEAIRAEMSGAGPE